METLESFQSRSLIERQRRTLHEQSVTELGRLCLSVEAKTTSSGLLTSDTMMGSTMVNSEGAAPRVVVAEDNFLTAHLITAALEAVGVVAAIGRFGDQVMSLVDEHRPPVIILNLNFNRPSGLELLRVLRVQERGLSPIVLINPGQADMRPQAQAYGARMFFENPFDPAVLAASVLELLGGE